MNAGVVKKGDNAPLGATATDGGVNFSVFSRDATLVELLLFDDEHAAKPATVIPLDPNRHRTYHYWHIFVPELKAGQVYAYRAHGPFAPERGLRFDGEKALLDPYGLAVTVPDAYDRQVAKLPGDNTLVVMKSVVADPGPALTPILERFFPGLLVPVEPLNKTSDTWAVFYSFDQYLWHPTGDPKHGIGIFFTFGAADGNPNPLRYTYNMGIGGNGVVPGRPNDNFGLGWARTDFSTDFVPFLRQRLDLGLDHEDVIEMYYNVSVTPWLNATLNLQVIEPGLKKIVDSSGNLKDVNTTVVAGLRLWARF